MIVPNMNIDPKRSYIMSSVKQKNTGIEVLLRSRLHRLGFRFRKNYEKLPGRPDIVLPKYQLAIFVHGCFWHGHENCHQGRRPKTNTDFWIPKIDENIKRDLKKINAIKKLGWRVAVVWQCSLDNDLERILERLTMWISATNSRVKFNEF
jgi:DNA mismatch endonuclease, patch repair protein